MSSKYSVVIVAGGKGTRMGSRIPKQFLPLSGKPVLMHTLERFFGTFPQTDMILVLPAGYKDYWQELCEEYGFKIPHKIALAGKERFFSVKNGLELVSSDYVAVHDGVRPLLDENIIKTGFKLLEKYPAVIPVIKPSSSCREITANGQTKAVDRNSFLLVQTPQFFRTDILKKAMQQDYRPNFTDEATAVENIGIQIVTFEGDRKNIKITTQEDLIFAEAVLSNFTKT